MMQSLCRRWRMRSPHRLVWAFRSCATYLNSKPSTYSSSSPTGAMMTTQRRNQPANQKSLSNLGLSMGITLPSMSPQPTATKQITIGKGDTPLTIIIYKKCTQTQSTNHQSRRTTRWRPQPRNQHLNLNRCEAWQQASPTRPKMSQHQCRKTSTFQHQTAQFHLARLSFLATRTSQNHTTMPRQNEAPHQRHRSSLLRQPMLHHTTKTTIRLPNQEEMKWKSRRLHRQQN